MTAAGDMFYGSLVRRLRHYVEDYWLFQYDPASGTEKTLFEFPGGVDGTTPDGPVTFVNGVLYGATFDGGTAGCGELFGFDVSSATYTVLYSFPCDAIGNHPGVDSLIEHGGVIHGTTAVGGTSSAGSVFSLTP